MLGIGDAAPGFTLVDDVGGRVTLASLLEGGAFVLYFYPADFTPVCTKQACMFRDVYPDLVAAGVRVVGVSPQNEVSHAEFKRRHHLPFPLLADTGRAMADAYGARGPLGVGIRRVSYFIDRDGRIADAVTADLRVGRHAAFVQRVIAHETTTRRDERRR